VRRNLFWKLALTFLALLLSVLVAVDFFAERALSRESQRATFEQLATIARFAKIPPLLPSLATAQPEDLESLKRWVAEAAGSSGSRVTVIRADGQVLADSQSHHPQPPGLGLRQPVPLGDLLP